MPDVIPYSRFDLNSLLSLQNQYAIDLSGISDANVDGSGNSYIQNLNTNLTNLNDTLINSEVNSDTLLLKQGTINNILDTENQRLLDKKNNIDSALIGQQRLLQINDSYRKRQAAYIKVIIVIIVALLLILILRFLSTNLTFIPEVIYYLLFIILISGTIIYVILLVYNINNRDPLNFDQLNLARPKIAPTLVPVVSSPTTPGSTANGAELKCIGKECCDVGTYFVNGECSPCDIGYTWNSTQNYCELNPIDISKVQINYQYDPQVPIPTNAQLSIIQIQLSDENGKIIPINKIETTDTNANNLSINSLINAENDDNISSYTVPIGTTITLYLSTNLKSSNKIFVAIVNKDNILNDAYNRITVKTIGTDNNIIDNLDTTSSYFTSNSKNLVVSYTT